MADLEEMVRGSIDMHVHFGPDPNAARRFDAMETVLNAQEMGLRAVVLKHNCYDTAPLADIIGRVATEIAVFGIVTLNFELGGINPHVVESSAKMGGKVIWMPTLSSANCRAKIGRYLGIELKGEGISILDAKGGILPEVIEILGIAKQYDMVVATGHISPAEILKLADSALEMGISKIVVTHVLTDEGMEATLGPAEQQQLVEKGVFMEHTFFPLLPLISRPSIKEMVKAIKTLGAEHCIISSDLGQAYYCPCAEGIRMFIGILLRSGVNEKEIELMAKINPARLLGLD